MRFGDDTDIQTVIRWEEGQSVAVAILELIGLKCDWLAYLIENGGRQVVRFVLCLRKVMIWGAWRQEGVGSFVHLGGAVLGAAGFLWEVLRDPRREQDL